MAKIIEPENAKSRNLDQHDISEWAGRKHRRRRKVWGAGTMVMMVVVILVPVLTLLGLFLLRGR